MQLLSFRRTAIIPLLLWLLANAAISQGQPFELQFSDTGAASDQQPFAEVATVNPRPEYPNSSLDAYPLDAEFASDDSDCDSCGTGYGDIHGGDVTFCGRLYNALTDALCGCDSCYTPEWRLLESSSFWVDSARTQNRMRVRWDYGLGMILPDRAEYFWAGVGRRGPNAELGSATVNKLDYHEMSLYAETSHGRFSAFTLMPYRSLYMNEAGHAAGMGDIQIGTKSMLHDTPIVQVTLQMTTSIMSANAKQGLGTGHMSLEPALLFGLALTGKDFVQAQVAQWIPLGGDPDFAGALLRWGVAWNRIVWQRDRDNMMTVNLDFVGWSFQHGSYTDPVLGQQNANNESYLYLGPGSRFLFCGKFEWGIGGLFALSDRHFAQQIVRTDLTMRY